jgi:putative Ca2+/H+ antiporter (TMEM165/GDT1 family)
VEASSLASHQSESTLSQALQNANLNLAYPLTTTEPPTDTEPLDDTWQVDANPRQVVKNQPNPPFWKLFGSTFITIFLAELGDKTQVATLLMTAESHAPWVVFTGAATALVTTSLLGVVVGHWLSSRVSPKTLDTAAGITLALLSLWLLLDVAQM